MLISPSAVRAPLLDLARVVPLQDSETRPLDLDHRVTTAHPETSTHQRIHGGKRSDAAARKNVALSLARRRGAYKKLEEGKKLSPITKFGEGLFRTGARLRYDAGRFWYK